MLCNLRDLRRISVLTCQRNESPPRLKGETGMLWSWVRFGSCFFFSFLFFSLLFFFPREKVHACMYVGFGFAKKKPRLRRGGEGERGRGRERERG